MPQISVRDLKAQPVNGDLGVPLGTVAEVTARIVAGNSASLGDSDRYFLLVNDVNGQPLPAPHRFDFSVPSYAKVQLVNNRFDLYAAENGKQPSVLTGDDAVKLDKVYVGRVVRVTVYETGSFSGIPHKLPPTIESWQDHGFGFSTSLIVLAEKP